jgi:hypothetical protein
MTTEEILSRWLKVADAATPVPGSTSRGLPSQNEEMLLLTARTAVPRLIAALRMALPHVKTYDEQWGGEVEGYVMDDIQKLLEGKEQRLD